MTEGLITRIGKWIDSKWESKASESMCEYRFHSLEDAAVKDKLSLKDEMRTIARDVSTIGTALADTIKQLGDAREEVGQLRISEQPYPDPTKDLADLKTRLEKIELYSGMTRKVDPTKPPVIKSAFQM